jgi:hypothetical protein
MDLAYDRISQYTGSHACLSHCRLRIFTAPGQAVVIATEVADNPGTSLTNMAGPLATQVWQEFGLPLEALVWIAHYPSRGFGLPEVFARVIFELTPQGLCHPQWQWRTITHVEAMIAQAL